MNQPHLHAFGLALSIVLGVVSAGCQSGKAQAQQQKATAAKSQADHQSLQGSVTNLGHRLETSLSEVAQRAAELRDDLVEKLRIGSPD